MTRPYKGGGYNPVYLPLWYYLGEESIAGDGTSQTLTLPAGTQIVELRPEGGVAYAALNGNPAMASSGIYMPDGSPEIIGPLANLNSVNVWAATDTTVHVMYFRENALEG